MRRRKIYQFLFIALVFLALPAKTVLCGPIKNEVKEAIRESDEAKAKKHAQLVSDLKSKLDLKAQEWIVFSKHGREAELKKLRHTDWNLAGLVNYPVPYDYYLRGFDYSTTETDVKTDSLFSPYKANINLSEKLYIEGIHSSDANDLRQYYYTLTRTIVLNFEYAQNKFIITDTDYGPFQIEHGWQKN